MFILPIGTDARLDHFPWATISLLLAKSLVFFGASCGWVPVEPLLLTYGDGIYPLQWLTSLFMHGGLLHLAGNLVFLWGFGLIVEGKLGWRRFLAAYLSLGMVESALEQICLRHMHGSSMGASAAIAGLMAMALVWAPRNGIIFGYGIVFSTLTRVGTFEITIVAFSALWAAVELISVYWFDLHAAAAMLHLLGGLLGLGMGVALLKQGRVDCEGWDLLSLWDRARRGTENVDRNHYGAIHHSAPIDSAPLARRRTRRLPVLCDWKETATHGIDALPTKGLRQRTEDRVRELLSAGKPGAALCVWSRLQHFLPDAQLGQQTLRDLFQGLFTVGKWHDSVHLMQEYIARFSEEADPVRIQAAMLLIHRLGRPRAALRMLKSSNFAALPRSLQDRYQKLELTAHKLVDSGVIEVSGEPGAEGAH